jgi:hypothetical protein
LRFDAVPNPTLITVRRIWSEGHFVLEDDQSIAQSAEGMVRVHGRRALAEAYLMVARMMRKGDKEGEARWRAIAEAVEVARVPKSL